MRPPPTARCSCRVQFFGEALQLSRTTSENGRTPDGTAVPVGGFADACGFDGTGGFGADSWDTDGADTPDVVVVGEELVCVGDETGTAAAEGLTGEPAAGVGDVVDAVRLPGIGASPRACAPCGIAARRAVTTSSLEGSCM